MSFIKLIVKTPARIAIESWLKTCLWARPRHSLHPDRIESILVFAYHGLGNFIMYTPAFKQLRDRYPAARIDREPFRLEI